MAITISSAPTPPDTADPANFATEATTYFEWFVSTLPADLAAITASDIIDELAESLVPTTDAAYDLGSASKRFRALYLSGSIDLDLPATVTRLTSGSSATHNLQASTRRFRVKMVGGGGAGNNADADAGGEGGAGGGGGGGAYVEFIVDAATLGISSFTYTIGAAGSGGTGGDTIYTDGTNTMTAGGGGLGGINSDNTQPRTAGGGSGGAVIDGAVSDLTVVDSRTGRNGFYGIIVPGNALSTGQLTIGGAGGGSPFGNGGSETRVTSAGSSVNGDDAGATEYGAGGGGAAASGAVAEASGGDGAGGLIVVEEYPY